MDEAFIFLGQATRPAEGWPGVDLFAEILGVLGFLLAMASIVWQIWTYRDTRKPKVQAQIHSARQAGRRCATVCARVWNYGQVSVYIDSVALGYDGPHPLSDASSGLPKGAVEIGGNLSLFPVTDFGDVLQPGQGCEYASPDNIAPAIASLASLPANRLYISVTSPLGELFRISGEEVKAVVDHVAQSVGGRAAENSPPEPPPPSVVSEN